MLKVSKYDYIEKVYLPLPSFLKLNDVCNFRINYIKRNIQLLRPLYNNGVKTSDKNRVVGSDTSEGLDNNKVKNFCLLSHGISPSRRQLHLAKMTTKMNQQRKD